MPKTAWCQWVRALQLKRARTPCCDSSTARSKISHCLFRQCCHSYELAALQSVSRRCRTIMSQTLSVVTLLNMTAREPVGLRHVCDLINVLQAEPLKSPSRLEDLTNMCLDCAGVTSENVAAKYNISREVQDKFAAQSHARAAAARASGRFDSQIVPVHTVLKDPKTGEEKRVTISQVPHHLNILLLVLACIAVQTVGAFSRCSLQRTANSGCLWTPHQKRGLPVFASSFRTRTCQPILICTPVDDADGASGIISSSCSLWFLYYAG